MATKAEQLRAQTARENSNHKRTGKSSAGSAQKSKTLQAATAGSAKGRSLHGRTKLQADAKAGKPDPGKITGFWQTGPHGGEEQTVNGVPGTGRGADGPANVTKASRKSTRGSVAGGEKANQKTRAVKRAVASPERRAERSIARAPAKKVRSR